MPYNLFFTDEALSSILERDDIFVYEVPTTNREDPGVAVTPIYLREKKSSQSYSPSNLFGQPLLLGIPRYKLQSFFVVNSHILFLNIRSDHHILVTFQKDFLSNGSDEMRQL